VSHSSDRIALKRGQRHLDDGSITIKSFQVRNLPKKYLLIGGVTATLLIFGSTVILVEILGKQISGGKTMERKVAVVLQTNEFMVRAFQGSITRIEPGEGPSRVLLKTYPPEVKGLRSGFYSFLVKGAKTNAEFKVEWSEIPNRSIEILSISLSEPFKQDKLVWKRIPKEVP